MAIGISYYDTVTLLGVMEAMDPLPSYWLDLGFTAEIRSDNEYIDFEKIDRTRRLAPFVLPSVSGKPIYERESTVTRFRPAYLKPKDAVDPARTIRKQPGQLASPVLPSLDQRYMAVVADILQTQRHAIEARLEWMAAQAVIHGRVEIAGEDYPAVTVDFRRAAGHTVTLAGNKRWGEAQANVIGDLNGWIRTVRTAKFGGAVNRLTIGADAWDAMIRDDGVKKQLDINTRGTVASLNTGVRGGQNVEYMGNLTPNLPVYVYAEHYHQADGKEVAILDSKDAILTGPNIAGVRAFGAILDHKALQPLPMFPKMWGENDPSVEYIMTQSAPLTIAVNPNNTLRATVL